MTAQVKSVSATSSALIPALFAAMLGLGIVFVVGHVQANSLHDAAHDVRHAKGFPCH